MTIVRVIDGKEHQIELTPDEIEQAHREYNMGGVAFYVDQWLNSNTDDAHIYQKMSPDAQKRVRDELLYAVADLADDQGIDCIDDEAGEYLHNAVRHEIARMFEP